MLITGVKRYGLHSWCLLIALLAIISLQKHVSSLKFSDAEIFMGLKILRKKTFRFL